MAARVLDGAAVAAAIRATVAPEVREFTAAAGRPPGLGIVLVGDDPALGDLRPQQGQVGRGVGTAGRSAAAAGRPRRSTSCWRWSRDLNASDEHDGILVQSPLPAAMGRDAAQRVFDAIDPAKDVDGFNPVNVGRLVQGRAHLAPCTPSGRDRDARSLRHRRSPARARW